MLDRNFVISYYWPQTCHVRNSRLTEGLAILEVHDWGYVRRPTSVISSPVRVCLMYWRGVYFQHIILLRRKSLAHRQHV